MKRALPFVLFALVALFAWAQERPAKVRAVVSVTWDLVEHKLYWDVAEGHRKGHDFIAERLMEQSVIDPDEGTMKVGDGKAKKLSKKSMAEINELLDAMTELAANSSEWYEEEDQAKPERVAQ